MPRKYVSRTIPKYTYFLTTGSGRESVDFTNGSMERHYQQVAETKLIVKEATSISEQKDTTWRYEEKKFAISNIGLCDERL